MREREHCITGVELLDNVREYSLTHSLTNKSKVYLLVYTKQEGDQTKDAEWWDHQLKVTWKGYGRKHSFYNFRESARRPFSPSIWPLPNYKLLRKAISLVLC